MLWGNQRRSFLEEYPRGTIIEEKNKRLKRKFPTVELPEIVLQLDAENSPYVRPFSGRDSRQQHGRWASEPGVPEAMSRARKLTKDMARDGKMMHYQASRPDTTESISDYDVLAIALLGGSAVSASLEDFRVREKRSQRLRPIMFRALRKHGIPERILAGDANKAIPFMLHRQQLARAEEGTGGLEAFRLSLRGMPTLSQLRRLCAGRTKVSEQIWTDQTSIDNVVHSLRSMPPRPLDDVLKFVNNFTIRQLSEDAGPNASMSLYGLETASKVNLLAPIVQYLQICLSQGFLDKDDKRTKILEMVGRGMLVALERGQGTARGTRPELFTLLTGRSLDNSELQPALFGLERVQRQENPKVHLIYARLLAELGALRLLWYAWREDLETVDATTFTRCVEVLSSAKGNAGMDHTTVTGDMEKDADLDLWAINSLDAYHTSVTRASYSSSFAGPFTSSEIRQAYESADIHQAMERFRDLISRAAAVTQSDADTEPDADTQPNE